MERSIMFLLGSGVSIPAKYPSTEEITTQILAGNNIIRNTDSRYYMPDNPSASEIKLTEKYLSNVLALLETIKDLMRDYDKKEKLNYEILYYFIHQIEDFETGELLNMALSPFLNQIKKSLVLPNGKDLSWIELFKEAEVYIRHTVWRMLYKNADTHQHLAFLSDAIKEDAITVNVATLNHDLLIESHLSDCGIKFYDGFSPPTNGVRYWDNHFGNENNLLKIHGSINWVSLHPDDGDWFDQRIGIVLDGDIDHAISPSGSMMRSTPEKEPQILVGTFNKIYEYTESIFSEVFCKFQALLGGAKTLVVSGYGFRDKGVNATILEWLYRDRDNRIVIVHPYPETLLNHSARGAIKKAYGGVAKKNFAVIPKSIEKTTWEEIRKCIVSEPVSAA